MYNQSLETFFNFLEENADCTLFWLESNSKNLHVDKFYLLLLSNQAIGISKLWQNRTKPWKVLRYSVVKIIECNYKSPFEI